MSSKWFPFRVKRETPAVRLVCFSPAGKGASIFRTWQAMAPEAVEVLAVQVPGRETRLKESPVDDVHLLADEICAALVPFLREPLALFGHCYGAVLAYEVARRIPDDLAAMLCVSSCRAPHLLAPTGWSSRSRTFADEVEILRDAFGDKVANLPAELLAELMAGLLADLVALDRYRCERPVEVGCPIHLFEWNRDHTVTTQDVHAWQQYTSATFTMSPVDADRDELGPEGASIANAIFRELCRREAIAPNHSEGA